MRVLVADDNLLSSTAVLDQLRRSGHSLAVVGTLREALGVAKREPPDLLLINLSVTAFDPPTLIKTFRSDPSIRNCRIVGFCGHLDHGRRTSALEAGCDQVITNAVALRQLATVLAGLQVPDRGDPSGEVR